MTTAVIQDATFGSKRNATALGIGIFFPIVRVLERERMRLVSNEVAGWRGWRSGGRPGHQLFHHGQSQDFALDSFEFSGISPGVRLGSTEFFNFFVDALDAALRTRVVGEKLRRILPFRLPFELLEKLGHGARIVPRVVQDLSAHDVGLRFSRS